MKGPRSTNHTLFAAAGLKPAEPEQCACAPGMCRGGQVINGFTVMGTQCRDARQPIDKNGFRKTDAGHPLLQKLIDSIGTIKADSAGFKHPAVAVWDFCAMYDVRDALIAGPAPIDMVLHCPKCHMQHIDAPEESDPSTWTVEKHGNWTNPPHRSHLCRGCGHIWRPADVPTNGVAAIKTKGKDDSPNDAAK